MFRRWLDDPGRRELADAGAHIESISAVELVVSVRRRARSWAHVSLVAGAVTAWATLAFMIYGTPAFSLWSFLVDPFVVGAIGGWAASLATPTIRWLTPASARRRAVSDSANSAFVERRVHSTRGRTGILVYCALAERMAAVVVDTAVAAAVAPTRLAAWRDQIEHAMAGGASTTAAAIAAMAPVFAAALPRLDDDVNELADAVDFETDRRGRR